MKQPASKFSPSPGFTLPALALCSTPLIAVPAFAEDGESPTPSAHQQREERRLTRDRAAACA